MRTIKFRGKRVDNDEWEYGLLFKYEEDYGWCIAHNNIRPNDYSELYPSCYATVIPETVGQFTGLYDKNGKEIYEGDIVGVNQFNMEMSFHEVEYDIENEYPAFDLNPIFKFADSNSLQYALIVYEVEVVGNIHDNKEENI